MYQPPNAIDLFPLFSSHINFLFCVCVLFSFCTPDTFLACRSGQRAPTRLVAGGNQGERIDGTEKEFPCRAGEIPVGAGSEG